MSGLDNTSFTVRTTALTTETLTPNDSIVVFTAGTAKTCNLPDATVSTTQPGRRYVVVNTGLGAITVDPFGSQTINGAATLSVTASTGRADFFSDGFNWFTVTAS